MLTLCIRTDKPEAELYLFDEEKELGRVVWLAHRQLAETIQRKIDELLRLQRRTLQDIEKVCVYRGPGSFTGLRIGISVANALAYSLQIPIAGAEGENWLKESLQSEPAPGPIVPMYGFDPHITKQKK